MSEEIITTVDNLINEINGALTSIDINYLTQKGLELTTLKYNLSDIVAGAELSEQEAKIHCIDGSTASGDKKMSAAEAEIRAVSETKNSYSRIKRRFETITEVCFSIDRRVKYLMRENNDGGKF